MAKQKTAFVCRDCGSEYSKWQGQCGGCNAWNTVVEFKLGPASSGRSSGASGSRGGFAGAVTEAQVLSEVSVEELPRFTTGVSEFDRVLGGGLVPGSAILIGGNPGAGKSTLLLQTMCYLAGQKEALYVTGEESLQQVAMRAQRLGLPSDKLRMMAETNITDICRSVEKYQPKVLVVDSIQVVHNDELSSAPGSVSQVRECAALLTRLAKQTGHGLVSGGTCH